MFYLLEVACKLALYDKKAVKYCSQEMKQIRKEKSFGSFFEDKIDFELTGLKDGTIGQQKIIVKIKPLLT